MEYSIFVCSSNNRETEFTDIPLSEGELSNNGIKLQISPYKDVISVILSPEDKSETIARIIHRITIPLRNFHNVICPDTGRDYFKVSQLVDFWTEKRQSVISNVRLPLFIFNGQDHTAEFAFGIIGRNYESAFQCREPRNNRALLAYTGRLSLEISRGVPGSPIPLEYAAESDDKSIVEYLYLRNMQGEERSPWVTVLREFCDYHYSFYNIEQEQPEAGLEPYWCSWTDWLSDDVTEELILSQVKKGTRMGIKNYILDDGWFGPGLDKDYEFDLNIGDWEADPEKVSDVRRLSEQVRKLGARLIAWCAPHAVGIGAACHQQRLPYLVKDRDQKLVLTKNRFNILCVQNPEAREIMADICVKIASEYCTDGAKYDLFNCIPDVPCHAGHHHDSRSKLLALEKLLELIWQRTREVNPDYIIELKQNYGGPFLARYAAVMRAGDTPYNPEGNFVRTAYLQGYTPYALNDYQTITNNDCPRDAASMIIKMLSAGIPSYSMDLCALNSELNSVITYYNDWYMETICKKKVFRRIPLDGDLNVWKCRTEEKDIFFLINGAHAVAIDPERRCLLLNGSVHDLIIIQNTNRFARSFDVSWKNHRGEETKTDRILIEDSELLRVDRGGMLVLEPVKAR